MRVRRTLGVAAATGLSLSLIATTAGPAAAATAAGSATTSLLGADATVTGLGEDVVGRLLDITTQATTFGGPRSTAGIVPASLGSQRVGQARASSDANATARSDGGALGELAGVLGLTAQPVDVTAQATADSALAAVDDVTAQLSGLFGVLGLDLTTTGVTSTAGPSQASATQGLQVSGLDLSLADLGLGSDVLGQLGLDQLLDLLGQLPLDGLPVNAVDQLDQVLARQSELTGTLADLGSITDGLDGIVGQLTAIDGSLGQLQNLDGLLTSLDGLDLAGLLGNASLLSTLDGLGCGLSLTSLSLVTDALDCLTGNLTGQRDILIGQDVTGLDGVLPSDLLTTVTGLTDTLTGALGSRMGDLDGLVGTLTDISAQLRDALGNLDGLLGLLPGLLPDAANLPLLNVGAFDVGITSVAGPDAASSSAIVACQPTDVTVLGQVFATPDCAGGLSGVSDLTATITDAVGTLTNLFNSLPLQGLLQAGDLHADLFTGLVSDVTDVDGVVTSTAGVNLLDLVVPSMVLDPSAVTNPLAGLGVPDVLGPLTGVVDNLQNTLGGLNLLDVAGPLTTLTSLAGQLDPTGSLGSTLDLVTSRIDGLDLGDLGSLSEAIATPGLDLQLDPISTATFSSSGIAPPTPTEPTVQPVADPSGGEPELPRTGGGLALLGMATLGGAVSLRRRRR